VLFEQLGCFVNTADSSFGSIQIIRRDVVVDIFEPGLGFLGPDYFSKFLSGDAFLRLKLSGPHLNLSDRAEPSVQTRVHG
jgi:hypothetical protein